LTPVLDPTCGSGTTAYVAERTPEPDDGADSQQIDRRHRVLVHRHRINHYGDEVLKVFDVARPADIATVEGSDRQGRTVR